MDSNDDTGQSPKDTAQKGKQNTKPATASARSAESLRMLRNRVVQAAEELRNLKRANAVLTERIEKLESTPRLDAKGTLVSFKEDPEKLRVTVEQFIHAIDEYLAEDSR